MKKNKSSENTGQLKSKVCFKVISKEELKKNRSNAYDYLI